MSDVTTTRAMVAGALRNWADRGWLRRLDAALGAFVAELSPSADGAVLLAVALTAHLEGHGHTCLVLRALLDEPDTLLAWPTDAIDALRYVLSRLPGEEKGWIASLTACDAVFVDRGGTDEGGGQPLVLSNGRLYLRRYWRHERRIVAEVVARGAERVPVDEALMRSSIERLFVARPDADTTDWQKIAAAIAMRGRFTIITGGPGTGKTYTAARVLALLFASAPDPSQLRIALAAPTGKAAARLKQTIDSALAELHDRVGDHLPLASWSSRIAPARTLHALLGTRRDSRHFRHDASHPLALDVLIVDEASMVHVEMMDALLAALPRTARLILLGDKDQLASVEAGAVLGEVCGDADAGRYVPDTAAYVRSVAQQTLPAATLDARGPAVAQQTVMLRRSERFSGAIDALARMVNGGDAAGAGELLTSTRDKTVGWTIASSPTAVVELASGGRVRADGYRPFLEALATRPDSLFVEEHELWVRRVLEAFDRFRVLCAVRAGEWGVEAINREIERRLAELRGLTIGDAWYEGRPVIVARNDYDVGVFNGDIGVALRTSSNDPRLRVHFNDGPTVRSVSVSRLSEVETAYAMTVHKSQGSEFAHTALVLPPEGSRVVTRELLYTGVTRAREAFTLITSRREALREAIMQTTRRSSGIGAMLRESIASPADGREDGLASRRARGDL